MCSELIRRKIPKNVSARPGRYGIEHGYVISLCTYLSKSYVEMYTMYDLSTITDGWRAREVK